MRVHFIAIGGSAMHNLAIALKQRGYHVTGSDDQIFEPSRSRLESYGLLPKSMGWDENTITEDIDVVILGMHAHSDNPELLQARALSIPIQSYPEFLYHEVKDKNRVVIGGSHGKTSITSMILHVTQACGLECDFMVGAQLEGFECMVSLTKDNSNAIFEGDEYLSSPLDRRPKFHHYYPNVAVLSGIAWDHINVFPSFAQYVEQFKIFVDSIEQGGQLIYYAGDPQLRAIAAKTTHVDLLPYDMHEHVIGDGQTYLLHQGQEWPCAVFGQHNMQNLEAARLVCASLGISGPAFYHSISTFGGASKRLEKLGSHASGHIFTDFAHSPSKLKATVNALKEQYPSHKLVAVMELHTYSSLNASFLPQYRGCLKSADQSVIYYSPKAIALKRLPPVLPDQITEAFGQPDLLVFNQPEQLEDFLKSLDMDNTNLLLMSSGNFGGVNVKSLLSEIVEMI